MNCENLEQVRENIDKIDDEIIKLIAKRGQFVAIASSFKKDENGVKDNSRVEKVIAKVREKATKCSVDADLVEEIYRKMISYFIDMEMKEFNKNKNDF